MTYSRVDFRPGRRVALLTQTQAAERLERSVNVRVGIAWGLLVFNTMTFFPDVSLLPIPGMVGKGIAQASLPAALLVALTINRKVVVRPNVFLCLVSLLVVGTILTDAAAPVFRYRVPHLPDDRVRGRAVAVDALVGSA